MLELVFTSAQNGLIPGRSGFCSVAWTEGMPKNLVAVLENLSSYNILYPPNDPRSINNPVSYSYQKIKVGNREMYVMSRIAFAGLDYTGRTNKIAHHIVIEDESELDNLQYGPVSAFLCEENFFTSWEGAPRLLPRRHKLKSAEVSGFYAENWGNILGNPEWAGYIADTFADNISVPGKAVYCEYEHEVHGNSMLMLIVEIVRLMREDYCKYFTFNTYFSAAANDIGCFFRAALPNCQVLSSIKRLKPSELLSLIDGAALPEYIPQTPAILAARSGIKPEYENDEFESGNVSNIVLEEMPAEEIELRPSRTIIRHSAVEEDNFEELIVDRKEIAPRTRLIIFLSGAVLLLVIFAAVLIMILKFMSASKEPVSAAEKEVTLSREEMEFASYEKEEFSVPAKKEEKKIAPEIKNIPEVEKQSVPEVSQKDKTEVSAKKTDKNNIKKTEPVEKKVKSVKKSEKKDKKQVKKSASEFSAADRLKLFLGMLDNKTSFKLPESLLNTQKFDLEISDQWDNEIRIPSVREYVERENNVSFKVYSINPMTVNLAPDKSNPEVMQVRLIDKSLEIKESVSAHSPKKKYIKTLTFHTPNGKYVWKNGWDNSYLAAVERGSVDKNFMYKKSADELLLKNYIDIKNDDFHKFRNAVVRWNKTAEELNNFKLNAKDKNRYVPSDFAAVRKGYEDLRKKLNEHPSRIDFDAVCADFEKFCRNMSGLNSKDINENLSKYFKKRNEEIIKEITARRDAMNIYGSRKTVSLRFDIQSQIDANNRSAEPDAKANARLQAKIDKLDVLIELEEYSEKLTYRLNSKTKTADTVVEIADLINSRISELEKLKINQGTLSEQDRKNIQKWVIPDGIGDNFIKRYKKQQTINKEINEKNKKNKPSKEKTDAEREAVSDLFMQYKLADKWIDLFNKNTLLTDDMIQEIRNELAGKVIRIEKGKK